MKLALFLSIQLFVFLQIPSVNAQNVTIGKQVWMSKNLNVDKFRNGDPIPEAKTKEEWLKAGENKQPAWCYYENNPANGTKYGKLYNWYAVNDIRGLAPIGYHTPSNGDWDTLETYLSSQTKETWKDPGKRMKSTSGWAFYDDQIKCSNCQNWNAEYRKKTACHVCKDTRSTGTKKVSGNGTNSSGFSGFPGGCRKDDSFDNMSYYGYWWSSSEYDLVSANARSLYYYKVFGDKIDKNEHYKYMGLSVRCIKD
jgi:uncharacterized protein (TIGR02145 family)